MPSPKDGTAGSLVAPAAPDEAKDADDADPGKVESVKATERELKTGKYGTSQVKPFTPPEVKPPESTPEDSAPPADEGPEESKQKKTSWIEIVLVDANDKPVPGEAYKVTLPDNSVKEGTLDANGFARVDGCDPGTCKVTFPKMDGKSWTKQ